MSVRGFNGNFRRARPFSRLRIDINESPAPPPPYRDRTDGTRRIGGMHVYVSLGVFDFEKKNKKKPIYTTVYRLRASDET